MRAALMLMALALAAAPAEAASKRAWDECGASDPERAIAGCTQVLADRQESRQNRALAHSNRGIARLNRSEVDQAIADFDEAIRLNPKHADAYNNRGNAYSRKGAWARSIADYSSAIDLPPRSALAHYNRGLAYHAAGELDRAIADYDEAIRLDPKDPDAHNERGRAHHAKSEFARAVADYGEAIRRDPRHMIAYFNRGLAHQAAGEFDRAIADFGEAARLAPESADIYGNRGIAHAAKGDLDRAIADYDEAIRRDPAYAAAYANRGLAHEAKGDTLRAEADFRAALAAPAKDDEGSAAHATARSQLETLGATVRDSARTQASPAPEKRAADKPVPIAPTHRRLALVIGNDAYQNLPPLRKAAADARAYAGLLEDQGFDVRLHTDLTRGEMEAAVSAFVEQIAPGDMALFAYSGHGWSDGVQNYIVGVDLPKTGSPDLLARMSLPLRNGVTGILDDLDRRGAALKVAIIDACRDNPFQSSVAGRSIGLGRGLARIDPPRGTFVVFSAGTGQVALDGLSSDDSDPNSVFTRSFIPLLKAGLPLQEATQKARIQVVALARSIDHDQQPAYYDELVGEVCLAGACAK